MSKVLKFGGTSVGSETNMRKVAEIIRHEQAKVTVLSAMSGTTDSLVKISSDAKNGKNCSATILLLKNKYDTCIQNLLSQYKEEALKKAEEVFSSIKTKAHNYKGISTEREILAQG